MTITTVAELAAELSKPTSQLLEQLSAAGVPAVMPDGHAIDWLPSES